MSIASTLNVAKEALLTHQAAISVTGHNIANVNTPGYSRQVLGLVTSVATPTGTGFQGNGVRGDSITRQYDKFMTQRLMNQNATINNLKTQQQSMRLIETSFNEVPGLAVNELLAKFWESWQALSNNPELSSNRQTVVQQAELLNVQLQSMSTELAQAKFDTGVSLKSSIEKVNAMTIQLADLNTKITSSETPQQEQNDLRDTRDNLLKDLGGYLEITFFEANNGAVTVMMADGHALVNNNQAWSLDWTGNTMQWVNVNSKGEAVRANLDSSTAMGGSIGGLMEVNSQLAEGDPDNYLGRLDALANSLVREVNQQHSQGVGLVSFSELLTSNEMANNAILLHTTVDTRTASEALTAGSLEINGRSIGRIAGSVNTYGLAMGKTANAAQAINAAAAGVLAKMTTQMAGNTVEAMGAGEDDYVLSFTINGVVDVSYTVDSAVDTDPTVLAANLVTDINAAILAYNTNAGLTPPPENLPLITIEAVVGNGGNGGAQDSIILRNTNKGDESSIVISDLTSVDNLGAPTPTTVTLDKLGLTAGTFQADSTHNTGELSLFAHGSPISIDGGADDTNLAHLGWAGTVSYSNQAASTSAALLGSTTTFNLNGYPITVNIPAPVFPAVSVTANAVALAAIAEINAWTDLTGVRAEIGDGTNGGAADSVVFFSDTNNIQVTSYNPGGNDVLGFGNFNKIGVAIADATADDGKLSYSYENNGVANSLMGLDYADTLKTDGGSFDLWLYNKDGSPALAQPVTIDLTRAYTLDDAAAAINASIKNATDLTIPWVQANVSGNRLVLTPDADHDFAFANDSSNFLASVGLNTFFTGHSVATISINQTVANNLSHLNAGKVSEFGEIFSGNTDNAILITNIQRDEGISYTGRGSSTDTLDGFYNSLIAEIGLKGKSVNTDLEYNQLVLDQLNEIRDATSGVSLDEEMANLIRFQHAYSAAAKLISISDDMMQTLLDTAGR